MKIAMIPARMGSNRLRKKNLRKINGLPMLVWAIRKCIASDIFDEIWVNSEHPVFGEIAVQEGVKFHHRPPELANDIATSEDFVFEFLKSHKCDYLFQVHSIAPLLTSKQVIEFVKKMINGRFDVLLSVVNEQIECLFKNEPINFSFDQKTNSQELIPVQRVTWSITGWRSSKFLATHEAGLCATYAGRVGVHEIDRFAGHVIKTEEDLFIARALLNLKKDP